MVIPFPACLENWTITRQHRRRPHLHWPPTLVGTSVPAAAVRRPHKETVLRTLGGLPSLWSSDARLRRYESGADAVPSPREEVAKCRGLSTLSGGRSTPSVSLEPRRSWARSRAR